MLPYLILDDYLLEDTKIEEYYHHFKNYNDSILYRDNSGSVEKITAIYGHDEYVSNSAELSQYKDETLNKIAEKFCEDFDLDVKYNCFILTTKANKILQWHIDGGGAVGSPQAAFMYDFRNTERAPTLFNYHGKEYVLDGYKAALINTSTMHMVDNSLYSERYNLRISLYGKTFEDIRDQIINKRKENKCLIP
jgi:hypothetical protein